MSKGKRRGQNEGSIYEMKNGRWRAAVHLGFRNGRRVRKTFTARTRAEVRDKLTEALRSHQLGLPIETKRQTLAQFLTFWLEESAKPRVRPRTLESYRWIVDSHLIPNLGRIQLAKLTPQLIQRFLNDLAKKDLSQRTVQHIHAVLRAALSRAEKWSMVPRNAAKLVEAPRVERKPIQPLEPDELPAFLSAIKDDRLEALYVAAVALGLRQGEILGLKWDAVDFGRGTIAVRHALQRVAGKLRLVETKTSRSRRTLYMPQFVAATLLDHRQRQARERQWMGTRWRETGFVFTSSIGTALDGTNVTHRLRKLLAKAGLRQMRFHDLRHACASLLLYKGVNMRLIMETLGHSQIALTMNTYSHVVPALRREVAAQMDEILNPLATSLATSHPNATVQ